MRTLESFWRIHRHKWCVSGPHDPGGSARHWGKSI